MAPLSLRFAVVRRLGFRDGACHGDRLSAARMLEVMDDSIDCPFMDHYSPDEQAEPLETVAVPSSWPGPSSTDSLRPRRTARLPANTCPALRGCSCPASDTLRWSTTRPGGPHHPGRDGRGMSPASFTAAGSGMLKEPFGAS